MKKKSHMNSLKKYGRKLLVLCIWILLWEVLSIKINEDIFLPSPVSVWITLIKLSVSVDFWVTIIYSSLRIILGFMLALFVGMILAVASYQFTFVRELISPIMKIVKAVPVASFIILALLWINKTNLSTLTSFMMVLPLIYANVAQGLHETDKKLLQMAKVFRLSKRKKILAIYIPSVLPYAISAVSVGIGLGWKAGIAAEVIGTPNGSIGERLYEAKLYLMTKELFAWTAVIIAVSILFERAVIYLLNRTKGKYERTEDVTAV